MNLETLPLFLNYWVFFVYKNTAFTESAGLGFQITWKYCSHSWYIKNVQVSEKNWTNHVEVMIPIIPMHALILFLKFKLEPEVPIFIVQPWKMEFLEKPFFIFRKHIQLTKERWIPRKWEARNVQTQGTSREALICSCQ